MTNRKDERRKKRKVKKQIEKQKYEKKMKVKEYNESFHLLKSYGYPVDDDIGKFRVMAITPERDNSKLCFVVQNEHGVMKSVYIDPEQPEKYRVNRHYDGSNPEETQQFFEALKNFKPRVENQKLELKEGVHHNGSIDVCENIDFDRIGKEVFEFKIGYYGKNPDPLTAIDEPYTIVGYYEPFVITPETDLSGITPLEAEKFANQMYYAGDCYTDDFYRYSKFSETRKHLRRYAGELLL